MSPVGSQRRRIVTCPACKGESLYGTENSARPFCSQRCKNNDFGAWAGEAFRVAAKASRPEDEPDEPSVPASGPH